MGIADFRSIFKKENKDRILWGIFGKWKGNHLKFCTQTLEFHLPKCFEFIVNKLPSFEKKPL